MDIGLFPGRIFDVSQKIAIATGGLTGVKEEMFAIKNRADVIIYEKPGYSSEGSKKAAVAAMLLCHERYCELSLSLEEFESELRWLEAERQFLRDQFTVAKLSMELEMARLNVGDNTGREKV